MKEDRRGDGKRVNLTPNELEQRYQTDVTKHVTSLVAGGRICYLHCSQGITDVRCACDISLSHRDADGAPLSFSNFLSNHYHDVNSTLCQKLVAFSLSLAAFKLVLNLELYLFEDHALPTDEPPLPSLPTQTEYHHDSHGHRPPSYL